MDGKGAGVHQSARWSSPFVGLRCEKSSFWLARLLGGCLELALGYWLSNLMVAGVRFIGESSWGCLSKVRIAVGGQQELLLPGLPVGSGEQKKPCTLGLLDFVRIRRVSAGGKGMYGDGSKHARTNGAWAQSMGCRW